jgi:hypothetical protein
MADFMSLTKKCPFRPPAWRWLQAAYRLDHPEDSFRPSKDRWIERAMRIQLGLAAGKSRKDLMRRDREVRHCLRAYDLWQDESSLAKAVIEARILADETADEIAKKFGMSRRTIEVYEKLFFDVRCKLIHSGYVFCTVLGREHCDWSCTPRFETVLKAIAYSRGSWLLDAVLDYVTTSVRPEAGEEVGRIVRGSTIRTVELKAMLALRMVPVNDQTRLGILKAGARVMAIETKAKGQPAADGLEDPSQIILDEYFRIVEAAPDAFGPVLPKILGVSKSVAA